MERRVQVQVVETAVRPLTLALDAIEFQLRRIADSLNAIEAGQRDGR